MADDLPPTLRRARRRRRPSVALLVVLALIAGLLAVARPAGAQPEGRRQVTLPAFPGAEGYGAATVGGRGGRVIVVSNLNDSGPGSLRAALEAVGPRFVVFRVGGVINLASSITVTSGRLTLAGQTAPGDGIVLQGAGIRIRAGEVIIRGLRVRVGDAPGGQHPSTRDGIAINGPAPDGGPVRNVIVDHCSISWAIDENLSLSRAEDVSIQWSLVSEGLNNSLHEKPRHSNALLIGEGSRRVSVHHNLFAHHWYRSPLVKGATSVELLGNVIYNWGAAATLFEDGGGDGPSDAVIAANSYMAGPSSRSPTAILVHRSTSRGSRIFIADNSGAQILVEGPPLRGAAPLAAPPLPVARQGAEGAAREVLAAAGASAPRRDPIDARVVRETRDGSGRIIDTVAEVGGWDVLAAWERGAAPLDADGDGLPDAWERLRGLNPRDRSDSSRLAPSGYTWIEEYANALIVVPAPAPASSRPTVAPPPGPASPPSAAPQPRRPAPGLRNAGFEQRWRDWRFVELGEGAGNMFPKAARTGEYGALIRGAGRIEQRVEGLAPNTAYVLVGYVRSTSPRSRSGLHVSGHGGPAVEAFTSSGAYERLTLTFTTGHGATSAVIAFVAPRSDDRIHFADDLTLSRAD
ncbi:MAG TPA: hypothetical protein PKD53_20315 [Chloroflexaceae bacterium]|nr:hypothetical protein [Chloroflexaceae bacterium]